jgi:hypothetical protein
MIMARWRELENDEDDHPRHPHAAPEKASRGSVWRQCASKQRYRTEGDALAMAALVVRRRGTQMRAYQCEMCHGGWHLTKQVTKEGR